MKRVFQQSTAVTVAIALFSNVAFAGVAETSVWTDRRAAGAALPAQLPVVLPPLGAARFLDSAARPLSEAFSGGTSSAPAGLSLPLASTFGSVRRIDRVPDPSAPTVVHIQDIHQNDEAQENIRRLVAPLLEGGRADTLALEGAFGSLSIEAFRRFPDRRAARAVADWLLSNHRISGAVHAALTAERNAATVVGVDDRAHYDANAEAARDALRRRPAVEAALSAARLKIDRRKTAFHPALADLDRLIADHNAGRSGFADYARALVDAARRAGAGCPAELRTFLEVLRLETGVHPAQVESERRALLAALVPRLSPAERNDLLLRSARAGRGEESLGAFYGHLSRLIASKSLSLDRFPAFRAYVRYVVLSDGLDVEAVLNAAAGLEDRLLARLPRTPVERAVVADSRRLDLLEKLVAFALVRTDWDALSRVPGDALVPASVAGAPGTPLSAEGLAPFLRFYREADERDRAMARNLLTAVRERRSRVAIVVTGGFHAPGLRRALLAGGVNVVSVVPRLTKADPNGASAYLGVFAQEKTPLDRLFAGEKLFLSPPVWIDPAAAGALERTASAALNDRPADGVDVERRGADTEARTRWDDSHDVAVTVRGERLRAVAVVATAASVAAALALAVIAASTDGRIALAAGVGSSVCVLASLWLAFLYAARRRAGLDRRARGPRAGSDRLLRRATRLAVLGLILLPTAALAGEMPPFPSMNWIVADGRFAGLPLSATLTLAIVMFGLSLRDARAFAAVAAEVRSSPHYRLPVLTTLYPEQMATPRSWESGPTEEEQRAFASKVVRPKRLALARLGVPLLVAFVTAVMSQQAFVWIGLPAGEVATDVTIFLTLTAFFWSRAHRRQYSVLDDFVRASWRGVARHITDEPEFLFLVEDGGQLAKLAFAARSRVVRALAVRGLQRLLARPGFLIEKRLALSLALTFDGNGLRPGADVREAATRWLLAGTDAGYGDEVKAEAALLRREWVAQLSPHAASVAYLLSGDWNERDRAAAERFFREQVFPAHPLWGGRLIDVRRSRYQSEDEEGEDVFPVLEQAFGLAGVSVTLLTIAFVRVSAHSAFAGPFFTLFGVAVAAAVAVAIAFRRAGFRAAVAAVFVAIVVPVSFLQSMLYRRAELTARYRPPADARFAVERGLDRRPVFTSEGLAQATYEEWRAERFAAIQDRAAALSAELDNNPAAAMREAASLFDELRGLASPRRISDPSGDKAFGEGLYDFDAEARATDRAYARLLHIIVTSASRIPKLTPAQRRVADEAVWLALTDDRDTVAALPDGTSRDAEDTPTGAFLHSYPGSDQAPLRNLAALYPALKAEAAAATEPPEVRRALSQIARALDLLAGDLGGFGDELKITEADVVRREEADAKKPAAGDVDAVAADDVPARIDGKNVLVSDPDIAAVNGDLGLGPRDLSIKLTAKVLNVLYRELLVGILLKSSEPEAAIVEARRLGAFVAEAPAPLRGRVRARLALHPNDAQHAAVIAELAAADRQGGGRADAGRPRDYLIAPAFRSWSAAVIVDALAATQDVALQRQALSEILRHHLASPTRRVSREESYEVAVLQSDPSRPGVLRNLYRGPVADLLLSTKDADVLKQALFLLYVDYLAVHETRIAFPDGRPAATAGEAFRTLLSERLKRVVSLPDTDPAKPELVYAMRKMAVLLPEIRGVAFPSIDNGQMRETFPPAEEEAKAMSDAFRNVLDRLTLPHSNKPAPLFWGLSAVGLASAGVTLASALAPIALNRRQRRAARSNAAPGAAAVPWIRALVEDFQEYFGPIRVMAVAAGLAAVQEGAVVALLHYWSNGSPWGWMAAVALNFSLHAFAGVFVQEEDGHWEPVTIFGAGRSPPVERARFSRAFQRAVLTGGSSLLAFAAGADATALSLFLAIGPHLVLNVGTVLSARPDAGTAPGFRARVAALAPTALALLIGAVLLTRAALPWGGAWILLSVASHPVFIERVVLPLIRLFPDAPPESPLSPNAPRVSEDHQRTVLRTLTLFLGGAYLSMFANALVPLLGISAWFARPDSLPTLIVFGLLPALPFAWSWALARLSTRPDNRFARAVRALLERLGTHVFPAVAGYAFGGMGAQAGAVAGAIVMLGWGLLGLFAARVGEAVVADRSTGRSLARRLLVNYAFVWAVGLIGGPLVLSLGAGLFSWALMGSGATVYTSEIFALSSLAATLLLFLATRFAIGRWSALRRELNPSSLLLAFAFLVPALGFHGYRFLNEIRERVLGTVVTMTVHVGNGRTIRLHGWPADAAMSEAELRTYFDVYPDKFLRDPVRDIELFPLTAPMNSEWGRWISRAEAKGQLSQIMIFSPVAADRIIAHEIGHDLFSRWSDERQRQWSSLYRVGYASYLAGRGAVVDVDYRDKRSPDELAAELVKVFVYSPRSLIDAGDLAPRGAEQDALKTMMLMIADNWVETTPTGAYFKAPNGTRVPMRGSSLIPENAAELQENWAFLDRFLQPRRDTRGDEPAARAAPPAPAAPAPGGEDARAIENNLGAVKILDVAGLLGRPVTDAYRRSAVEETTATLLLLDETTVRSMSPKVLRALVRRRGLLITRSAAVKSEANALVRKAGLEEDAMVIEEPSLYVNAARGTVFDADQLLAYLERLRVPTLLVVAPPGCGFESRRPDTLERLRKLFSIGTYLLPLGRDLKAVLRLNRDA